MAAYADGNDLIARYDVDMVGDLATDGREAVDPSIVPSLPLVATALLDASGEVDIALINGGRYQPADLELLTGNSQSKLKRIVCDIAMALLLQRRTDPAYLELAERIANGAREHKNALARGENVFGIQAVVDAGFIEYSAVSAVDIDRRNTLPTRMGRYFPITETVVPERY